MGKFTSGKASILALLTATAISAFLLFKTFNVVSADDNHGQNNQNQGNNNHNDNNDRDHNHDHDHSTPTPTPTPTPVEFNFPSCESTLSSLGDEAHYSDGLHQIVGGSLLSGSDDVYSLSSGNYLQCFCPAEGTQGIQTNWLKSNHPISGWTFVNGSVWGLGNSNYNTQNSNFTCSSNESSPTPSGSPESTPTPTDNSNNNSSNNTSAPSAPVCGASKPGTPTILSAVQHGTSVTLTWSAVPDATSYSIVYGTGSGYQYGVANTGNVTSYTINSLAPGVVYHFAVNAVNDCMPGDPGTFGGTGGEVLGASTMAGTGSFDETFYQAIMSIGAALSAIGIKGLKKGKKVSSKKK